MCSVHKFLIYIQSEYVYTMSNIVCLYNVKLSKSGFALTVSVVAQMGNRNECFLILIKLISE